MPSEARHSSSPVATPATQQRSSRFGRFELQPAERRLLDDGQPVALGARAFDLLVLLVERAGQLVAKNDLLAQVWSGVVVEENNLQVQISALRKALGQSAVTTVPGRGYRFELPVERADALAPGTPLVSAAPERLPWRRCRRALARICPAGRLPLYGRSQDLAMIKALIGEHGVVTIVGAGGIGKTRVAQAVAAEIAAKSAADFPDGVWWIELASLSDDALVPSTVARALGMQLLGDRSPVEAVTALLAPQRLLLVLDNCEHLTETVAELIESIRAAAPQVRILVTSQETLKTAEEHIYRVSGLAVPVDDGAENALHAGAVELFVARAQGVDPNFTLTPEHARAVIEICRRLDGIPLAIELAAARLPLLGVEGLRARIDERFNILTAGARVVLRRHQTLRSTLEWSHGLLTADERTVFRRLGVFAGSFTLDAAQHVVSDAHIDTWAALDHLGALVDKSLVLAEGDPVPRYRLLETTRTYALERLAEAGETERMLRRHAEALFAVLAAYEMDDRRWRTTPADTAALAAEIDNLRAALAWVVAVPAGTDLVVPLAGVAYHVWWATLDTAEGLERCLALRKHVHDEVETSDAARFWLAVARLGLMTSEPREGYEAAQRAAELYRALGDDSRRYDALVCLAVQSSSTAEREPAIAEATRLERASWPGRQRGGLLYAQCWWHARLGRFEEALASAQQMVAINRAGENPIGAHAAMANVVSMELLLGRIDAALEHSREAIAGLEAVGAGAGAGFLTWTAMIALILLHRLDEAVDAGRTARKLMRREGDENRLLSALALLAASQGRFAAAARVIGHDDANLARTGEVVRPVAALLRARLGPMLEAALAAPELARLRKEGAAMRDDQAFRLGFGDDA
jgi:predicted ATPase/DNA-binding winged helix-turn-helix (wHTH) protein